MSANTKAQELAEEFRRLADWSRRTRTRERYESSAWFYLDSQASTFEQAAQMVEDKLGD